jgi:hypothetical protein
MTSSTPDQAAVLARLEKLERDVLAGNQRNRM